ncbi:MAG: hypothetical protein FJ319_06980 [SAR202 cluster bacterium]|nr:hypothetical protein [SAR202 cluster bacterium]
MVIRTTLFAVVSAFLFATISAATAAGSANAQSPPIFPQSYTGNITAGGQPVPDGHYVVARIDTRYQSEPIQVKNGTYSNLLVSVPDDTFNNALITFHLDGSPDRATQTDRVVVKYGPSTEAFKSGFNLTFAGIPTPTPTPSATPTITPTPTLTPVPTNTPIFTPTPQVANPAVFSGQIAVVGGRVPSGAVLIARIEDYESAPAVVNGDRYVNLVLAPGNPKYIGKPIEFFLNGMKSSTTARFVSGAFENNFGVVFTGLSTPTPEPPTATPVPPTVTSTPVPPTATVEPPTPTATAVPATPTATAAPATATATAPAATPDTQGSPTVIATTTTAPADSGSDLQPNNARYLVCHARATPLAVGLANMLLLIAPVGLVFGIRRFRGRF